MYWKTTEAEGAGYFRAALNEKKKSIGLLGVEATENSLQKRGGGLGVDLCVCF